ncbi:hypothetical protein D7S89_10005 [Trinickia fusca]|uniref:Uncharacterized protein n=1 Tax=Trinickia fusca TaxID=2419777 RepID=A0A494XM39_9BURK|nr:hypothetical protein D7S89_10005 [Trinickia fusca]
MPIRCSVEARRGAASAERGTTRNGELSFIGKTGENLQTEGAGPRQTPRAGERPGCEAESVRRAAAATRAHRAASTGDVRQ